MHPKLTQICNNDGGGASTGAIHDIHPANISIPVAINSEVKKTILSSMLHPSLIISLSRTINFTRYWIGFHFISHIGSSGSN